MIWNERERGANYKALLYDLANGMDEERRREG
jgi:hypothetical protein